MYRDPMDEYNQQPAVSHRGLSIAIWCGLAIAGLVLYSRSQSGLALSGANNVVVGCLLAAFAGAVSLFAWVLSRQSRRVQESGVWQIIEGMSTLMPPAVIAMAILPVSAEIRPWVLGLILIAGSFGLIFLSDIEFTNGRTHRFHRREFLFDRGQGNSFLEKIDVVEPVTDLAYRRRERVETDRNTQTAAAATPQPAPPTASPVVNGKLQQQISRFLARNGEDRVDGVWNVHFDLDQKRTVVHVPFSPAFSTRPNVECSLVDGDGVTLKVAEVHPYGVRLEARRSQTDRPADVTISFNAAAKPASRNRNHSSTFSVAPSSANVGASSVARTVAASADSEFSLGNPADDVNQSVDRISRTTGPHNPPRRSPLEPGSNSISRAS